LNAIGLPELVTKSLQEYEEMAVRLAHDPALLQELKTRLAANRTTTPLFDTVQFCRYLENAYSEMWRRCQDGLPAASFSVERRQQPAKPRKNQISADFQQTQLQI
jgi:hypothetical protein